MEFLYFFGDRVEILENGVGGGSGEVKGSAPALGSAIWRVRGAIRFDVGQVHPEIA